MKKIFILAATTVLFTSCLKQYTCTCVDPATAEENKMTYQTNKESHASRLCNDWQTRTRAAIPEKVRYTCTLD